MQSLITYSIMRILARSNGLLAPRGKVMTKADIFIQIMFEVSGKPKMKISDTLQHFRKVHPGGNWDVEVPCEKEKKLLDDLRKEVPGILAWSVKGAVEVSKFEDND